ncbi:MAG: hypothetical protein LBM07_05630 [Culturomica sp.]|jgi:hypothetical protein|nr:hypothetical protein [Culturomica sp.]
MLLRDKIDSEKPSSLNLYKEGMFWKAYNYSAYNFSRLVKVYVVKKKYVKEMKSEVVSVGFPDKMLKEFVFRMQELCGNLDVSETEVGGVLADELPADYEQGYLDWFSACKCAEVVRQDTIHLPTPLPSPPLGDGAKEILKSLRDFPILQKSPLDVQMFLIDLQERLKKLDNGTL